MKQKQKNSIVAQNDRLPERAQQHNGGFATHEHRHPHSHGPVPLIVSGLTVTYADGTPALKNVSFTLAAGEKAALIGGNGAGKTSLFLTIAGVLKPDAGEILIGDIPVDKDHLMTIRSKVGLVFQNPDDQLFMPKIYDDIAFGPRNFGHSEEDVREKVRTVLTALEAEHLMNRSSLKLSGGEKRVCAIASVLVMNPHVLLFDEPTAFLDMKAKHRFMDILASLDQTRLVATHDPAVAAAVAERVIVLDHGTIAADGPSAEVLAAYFSAI
ncbi:putative ABC transporter ATP-binding protein [Clostridia bacterium]|nr:putative ABC transporter ATP-binding protein [Clostridia bacterium]